MARTFNGSSQYLRNSANITGGEFTVAAWMYFSSVTGTQFQVCQWAETTGQKHWYLATVGSTVYFGHSQDGTTGINKTHSTTLSTGQWYHICARYKNSTSKYLSVNGSHEAATAPGVIYSSGTPGFTIGVDPGTSYTLFWSGRIADCASWNASLTDAEVEAMAAGLRTADQVRPSALVAQWPFGGLRPDNDRDQWAKAYDLTATNSPGSADHPRLWYPSAPQIINATASTTKYWLFANRNAAIIG